MLTNRVQTLAKQAKQVENIKLQSSSSALFYITVREEINNTNNMMPVVEVLDPHVTNMYTPQGLVAPAILYANEQSMVTNNMVTS